MSLAVLVTLATAIDIFRPFLYKWLIDAASRHATVPDLLKIVWFILIAASLNHIIWRVLLWINNYFQPRVMSDLMNTCYEYIHGHSYNFFNNSFVGSLVTRVRRYQKGFEDIADQVYFNVGRTVLRIIITVAVLLYYLPIFGVIVLVWSVLFLAFNYFFAEFTLKYNLERANQDTLTTAQLADTITNSLNLKLFSSFASEFAAFKRITDKLYRLRKRAWDWGNIREVIQGTFVVGMEFGVFYLAVIMWGRGELTVGDFVLLQVYLVQIFDHLWDVGRQIRTIYDSLADSNEMTEILLQPHEVQDKPGAAVLVPKGGRIEFKHVTFAYQDNNIFDDFNLAVRPGERVALVGPSGGGKTTFVKMLFRFWDIQHGEILVDGQNIADVTQDSLRDVISLVPQEPILFHRSLRDNIRYGKPDATEEEVVRAAELAHAHEFIASFPLGYDTLVGERGVKLSGGERQRVAIARAILKNAPILVLDEATSSLDSESELYIQDALKNLMKGKTTIVIAHRLSTIMQMDRIIVIQGGKIIEEGKHEELLKAQQGMYQKLWGIQAGGFAAE